MKLKDIVKEIVKNKDQFNNLNESNSNSKLESIVKDIINEYLTEINEGTKVPKLRNLNPQELANNGKFLIGLAVDDLDEIGGFEFNENQKRVIKMWLAEYTSMLIQQLTNKIVPPTRLS